METVTDKKVTKEKKALFGGPFGVALVVAVLASIAAIPLLMKLAPVSGQHESAEGDVAPASDAAAIAAATGQSPDSESEAGLGEAAVVDVERSAAADAGNVSDKAEPDADDVTKAEPVATSDATAAPGRDTDKARDTDKVAAADAAVADVPVDPSADENAASLDSESGNATAESGDAPDALAIREISATDAETNEMIGGRISLVSANGPGVVVFEDGTRYTPGTVMPNGHVVSTIESDRVILEREEMVSVLRLD